MALFFETFSCQNKVIHFRSNFWQTYVIYFTKCLYVVLFEFCVTNVEIFMIFDCFVSLLGYSGLLWIFHVDTYG